MKINQVFKMKTAVVLLAGLAVLGSCKKTDDSALSSDDTQNVNSESVADTQISETADISNSVVTGTTATQYGGGRAQTEYNLTGQITDPRLGSATITLNTTGTKDAPAGTITIDFGTDGVTYNGVTRKGQIIISYSGKKDVAGSYRTLSYSNYSRNGILFDNGMSFKETNLTDSTNSNSIKSIKFHHELTGGKLTFPDQSTITRIADYDVTLDYTNGTLTLSADPNATNSASGETRKTVKYTMDITQPVVYKATCAASNIYLAASGTKLFTVNSVLKYTLDYGDGTCDNMITIAVGGKVISIPVNGDGN